MSPLAVAQLRLTGQTVDPEFFSFFSETSSLLLLARKAPDDLKCALFEDCNIVLMGLSFLPTFHSLEYKLHKAEFKQLFVVEVASLLESFLFDHEFGLLFDSIIMHCEPLVDEFLFLGCLVYLKHSICGLVSGMDLS